MNTHTKNTPSITVTELRLAQQKIEEFASSKKPAALVFNREFNIENLIFSFDSKTQKKHFAKMYNRVVHKPSFKSISIFLRSLSKYSTCLPIKMDYSEHEKSIQQARKEWKILRDKAEEARLKYKELKGSFYKI